MKRIAELMFEACFLKKIPRTGYQFLGAGHESVAEHVYAATFIAFLLSRLEPKANALRLITMSLVHDLPEARLGDLNYVQKRYVQPDEPAAVSDAFQDLAMGADLSRLIAEFNEGLTLEAQLARDADQLSLLLDLKSMADLGIRTPAAWMPHVEKRLQTDLAKQLAQQILIMPNDGWWMKIFIDSNKVIP